MALDFTGKIVLITGGGNGIGAASACKFAEAGARVAVIDRDGDAARRVAAEIGNGATGHALDVSDGEAFARLAADIATKEGGIDVLVNSAGTITRQTIAAMPAADWDRIMAVNLRGPFNGTQAVIPHMKQRGGGAIVNVASVAGLIGFPKHAAYAASKHGVVGLTRTAALEYGRHGIRINAVCPGFTRTPMVTDQLLGGSAEAEKQLAARVPLGRLATPEEIAAAIVYACSDEAGFMIGHTLVLDGGITAA
jgi:NAD(P)-dependent dehydrogenase (short-subunit alcohol dehydrogenase family)